MPIRILTPHGGAGSCTSFLCQSPLKQALENAGCGLPLELQLLWQGQERAVVALGGGREAHKFEIRKLLHFVLLAAVAIPPSVEDTNAPFTPCIQSFLRSENGLVSATSITM